MMPVTQSAPPPQMPPGGMPPPKAPSAPIDQKMLGNIILAGQKAMYDKKSRKFFLNGLRKEGNPVDIMAAEIAGLMKLLDDKSKGRIPKQVIVPAAIALLYDAVKFASEAGIFTMNKQMLAETSKKIVVALMKIYGVLDELQKLSAKPAAQPPAAPAQPPAPGLIQQAQGGA